jgi:hypothetical protein
VVRQWQRGGRPCCHRLVSRSVNQACICEFDELADTTHHILRLASCTADRQYGSKLVVRSGLWRPLLSCYLQCTQQKTEPGGQLRRPGSSLTVAYSYGFTCCQRPPRPIPPPMR